MCPCDRFESELIKAIKKWFYATIYFKLRGEGILIFLFKIQSSSESLFIQTSVNIILLPFINLEMHLTPRPQHWPLIGVTC